MTTVNPNTHTHLEPLRPIYGPKDDRYSQLAAWLDANADEHTTPIGSLGPVERAEWHEVYVLGKDRSETFERSCAAVEYPDFPRDAIARPSWAETFVDDQSVDSDTHFPAARWTTRLHSDDTAAASIDQDLEYDPDTGAIAHGPVYLSVWPGGDELITFTNPDDARRLARVLLDAADRFEAATR